MTELEKIAYAKSFIDKLQMVLIPSTIGKYPMMMWLTTCDYPDASSMYQISFVKLLITEG